MNLSAQVPRPIHWIPDQKPRNSSQPEKCVGKRRFSGGTVKANPGCVDAAVGDLFLVVSYQLPVICCQMPVSLMD